MAEKCPKCGSTNVSSTALGYAEKIAEGAVVMPIGLLGKIGSKAAGNANSGNILANVALKVGGSLLDGVCSSIASGISKNVSTERKCKCCGHVFHSEPDKGWL